MYCPASGAFLRFGFCPTHVAPRESEHCFLPLPHLPLALARLSIRSDSVHVGILGFHLCSVPASRGLQKNSGGRSRTRTRSHSPCAGGSSRKRFSSGGNAADAWKSTPPSNGCPLLSDLIHMPVWRLAVSNPRSCASYHLLVTLLGASFSRATHLQLQRRTTYVFSSSITNQPLFIVSLS